MSIEIGAVVAGRYRIEKELAAGGMGSVFVAVDQKFSEQVALKVAAASGQAYDAFKTRFEREARIGNRLGRTSGIVRAFDWGVLEDKFRLYLAMDLVKGAKALDLKTGTLVERLQRLHLASMLVAEVHRHNVIHRDLKPANFLQDESGEVMLTDFGLAKIPGESDPAGVEVTLSQVAMGTPMFMPPEQFEDAKNVDKRADIYPLGVMLFYALTQQYPFRGEPTSIWKKQMMSLDGRAPRPDPKVVNPQVDDDLAELCRQAMALKVSERMQSADEMVEGLSLALLSRTGQRPVSRRYSSGAIPVPQISPATPTPPTAAAPNPHTVDGAVTMAHSHDTPAPTGPASQATVGHDSAIPIPAGPPPGPNDSNAANYPTPAHPSSYPAPANPGSSPTVPAGSYAGPGFSSAPPPAGGQGMGLLVGVLLAMLLLGGVLVGVVVADLGGVRTQWLAKVMGGDPGGGEEPGPSAVSYRLVNLVPLDGAMTSQPKINVAGEIDPAGPGEVVIDGILRSIDEQGKFHLDGLGLEEGWNTVTLEVKPRGGTPFTRTISVGVDTTAPELVLGEPAEGFSTADDKVAVSGMVLDDMLQSVTLNGELVSSKSGRFSTELELPEVGEYELVLRAEDQGGHVTETRRKIRRVPAGVLVTITEPAAGAYVGPEVQISGRVEGEVAPTDLELEVGSQTARPRADGSFAFTAHLVGGEQELNLVARWRGDEVAKVGVAVVVDDTAPVLSFVRPAPAVTEEGQLELEVVARDEAPWCEVRFGERVRRVERGDTLTLSVPLALGANEVTLVAADAAGNVSPPLTVSITRREVRTRTLPWSNGLAGALERSGSECSGYLPGGGERAFLRVDVASGRDCEFNTDGSGFDTILILYDEEGGELARDDDGGVSSLCSAIRTYLDPGSYYLAVVGYDSNTTGNWICRWAASGASRDEPLFLSLNQRTERTLGAGQQLWGRIELAQAEECVIDTSGSSFDTVLTLFDSAGNKIAEDDDGGQGTAARLAVDLEPGTYLVSVTGFGSGSVVLARLEPDHRADSPVLGLGQPHTSTLASGSSEWFQVHIERAGFHAFVTEGSSFDTLLFLYDEGGEQLAYNDDSPNSTTSRIFTSLSPGTYYLEVQGYGGTASGSLSMAWSESVSDSDFLELPLNGELTGTLAPGARVYARVTVSTTGVFSFDTEGSSFDTVLSLTDGSGGSWGWDDNSGPDGLTSRLQVDLPVGTYYLLLTGHHTAPGTYRVHWPLPGATRASAAQLYMGEPYEGSMPRGQDFWFQLYVSQPADAVFSSEGSGGSVRLTLYDEAGSRLASSDDGTLVFDVPQPGNYYLSAFADGSGSQSLRCAWLGMLASSRGRSTASPLAMGREVRRQLPSGEAYWARLVLGRETNLRLSTNGSSFDTILTLYDAEGLELVTNDDAPDAGTTSLIEATVGAGTYYVRATGYSGAQGELKLMAQAQ
jgi:serine/threonine protein kinase